jgi:hypothetical protein
VTVAKQARLSDNQKKCESKKEKQISIPKKKHSSKELLYIHPFSRKKKSSRLLIISSLSLLAQISCPKSTRLENSKSSQKRKTEAE